uniref:Uncharacterized protein n=1 Tax=Enterovibrio norvegicus TaxID=188144 RepID=A0A0H4A0U0_9GAMM|nr:hypothetical protein [Enterovibrio norvegicus]
MSSPFVESDAITKKTYQYIHHEQTEIPPLSLGAIVGMLISLFHFLITKLKAKRDV